MRPPSEILLDLLTGVTIDATERRALALYVLTLARRVRELENAAQSSDTERAK